MLHREETAAAAAAAVVESSFATSEYPTLPTRQTAYSDRNIRSRRRSLVLLFLSVIIITTYTV